MSTANKLLQAASGGAGGDPVYVEDVFSTFLYAGQTSSLEINNGLDLDGEGGLVWIKPRTDAGSNSLFDTERTLSKRLISGSSNAEQLLSGNFTSFDSDGFTLAGNTGALNDPLHTFVSWSFRKQAGFFDVVTYTGDGTSARTVGHNLGCKPGMIIVKRTDSSADWQVWHRNTGLTYNVAHLNTSAAWTNTGGDNAAFHEFSGSATNFTLGQGSRLNDTNANSATYIAYLFAGQNDADSQIFGDDSDEAIIKCGSYTGNGSSTGPEIDLGFEPQWLIAKRTDGSNDWWLVDNMRGMVNGGNDAVLFPGQNYAEDSSNVIKPTSTGFQLQDSGARVNASGGTYIYIAIRRPMKTPAAGTEVFAVARGDSSGDPEFISGFPVDFAFYKDVDHVANWDVGARLIAKTTMHFNSTIAETGFTPFMFDYQNGVIDGAFSSDFYAWMFKRATGFFDVVAYTGDGASSHAITHNLGVSPELIITKRRDSSGDWRTATNFSASTYSLYKVNEVDPATNINYAAYGMYAAKPTATTFTVGSGANVNASSGTYVSYLFGTVAGVSKVGSVVHSGTTNVDCGFSAGARFIMLKRSDQNSGWYVWDSA
jgi:hypothetical protein